MKQYWPLIVVCVIFVCWAHSVRSQGFANSSYYTGSQPPLQASGVNWVSFHALDATYGNHSGINWQSLGA